MADNRLLSPQELGAPVSIKRRQSMLVPVAYSENLMPSLRLAKSSRMARKISNWLLFLLAISLSFMLFAPWQQSVSGTGSVLAFAPGQRPQPIEATIYGRIKEWGEGIYENAHVKKDQVICTIQDLDDEYSERLESQLNNYKLVEQFAKQQLFANQNALSAAQLIIESYTNNVSAYEKVKEETIAAQDAYIKMAMDKVRAQQQQQAEYESAIFQIQEELKRHITLQQEGNIPLQKVQEIERKLQESNSKVKQAMAYVDAANNELEGKRRERSAKIQKAQVDIDYANAVLRDGESKIAKLESEVAKAEQDLKKAQNDLLDIQVKVARQGTQILTAPFDGYIVEIIPNMGTAVLKQGDKICTIVPDTADRSVQIWMNGNDAPLVEPGRHVRLQFEGWPALQFVGWPSVAVGTFGGEVISVDSTDNGKGKFRVLVMPHDEEHEWPDERFLKQGVRANGWVLLDRVPLWYEVWRRLNGFPPVVEMEEDDKSDKRKPPKLPK